jgi:hypothetical protein
MNRAKSPINLGKSNDTGAKGSASAWRNQNPMNTRVKSHDPSDFSSSVHPLIALVDFARSE